jgi:aerobic carbon-monoxide dehydrogenase medium subunit
MRKHRVTEYKMIPSSFEYKRANSVEEAIGLLSEGYAKVLSGGHSLIPTLKLRLNSPDSLVDIAKISSLKGIKIEENNLVIGSTTTHQEIATSNLVKQHFALLSEGAGAIGDVQVRNKGTLGGSLAHADPSADWPALVLAADATIEVQGVGGKRTIKADDFFTGFFATALEEDEIITAIHFPIPETGTKSTYQKFVQPASRFAIVGCAIVKQPSGKVRVAFSGVSDNAFRDSAVENAVSSGKSNEDSALSAAEGVSIMSDHYASEEYRKHLAKVYAKRALMAVA